MAAGGRKPMFLPILYQYRFAKDKTTFCYHSRYLSVGLSFGKITSVDGFSISTLPINLEFVYHIAPMIP